MCWYLPETDAFACGAAAPVMDAARALQHLKHYAAHYNIDKRRIILTGHSAGVRHRLCLVFHCFLASLGEAVALYFTAFVAKDSVLP